MLVEEEARDFRAGHTRQRPHRGLDDGDVEAQFASDGGGFEPDIAGPDDDQFGARLEARPDRIDIGGGAQQMHAEQIRARKGQFARPCAGRQHQRVVRKLAAAFEPHAAVGAVDPDRAHAGQQRDLLLGVDFGRTQQQPVDADFTREIGLGQRRALIGCHALLADQRDFAGETARPEPLRSLAAGLAGADNDDPIVLAQVHPGPSLTAPVCAAPAAAAQAGLELHRARGQHPAP